MALVQFKKIDPAAIIPSRATPCSAGFDLSALHDIEIANCDGSIIVDTGIAVRLPPGTYGRVAARSGAAVRKHFNVTAGVIDRDYTGAIGVIIHGTRQSTSKSNSYTKIAAGERFAQLVIEHIFTGDSEEVTEFDDLGVPAHEGFGSTGTGL